ncbi:MAG: peptidoglycan DD-metalloendopeptidase family protein [Lachnospiraceae bacterium]|nr:peptidoglycan DD-metalloendopeptidase family protein [Lachnospiraceae bacterium]
MKKLYKLLATALIMSFMLCAFAPEAFADTRAEVEGQIDELESEKQSVAGRLSELRSQFADTQAYISELDSEIERVKGELEEKEAEIAGLELKLRDISVRLKDAKVKENRQYEALKKRIRQLYEAGETKYLEIVFGSKDISSLINNVEYINSINEYDAKLLNDLSEIVARTRALQEEMDEKLARVEAARDELASEKAEYEAVLEAKAEELLAINASINEAEAQIASIEEDIDAERGILASIAAAEAAAAAAQANLEAQGVSPSASYTTSSGFSWPLPGYTGISSEFGYRNCPFHGEEFHYGIDIPAAAGSSVLAAGSGYVLVAAYDWSLGNYLIIDHGNGTWTYYLHNSALYVYQGQYVEQGQAIAAVGSTGSSTGPHLDFRVKVYGSYVNPLAYVSPY